MDLDAYVKSAKRTVNPSLDDRDRLLDAAAGLAEESAEVLGLVRKRAFQQRDIPREKLIEELGDALWCLAITADALRFGGPVAICSWPPGDHLPAELAA